MKDRKRRGVTRRGFLKGAAATSAGIALGGLSARTTIGATVSGPKEIFLGAPYAMTGADAMAQLQNVKGVDVALEIVNNYHDVDLPLARGKGLPNLGGAMMRVIYSDTLGLPEKGASETERM